MRIIDADQAKEIAEVSLGDIFLQTAVKLLIDKVPTIDAVPVVRGKFRKSNEEIESYGYDYTCLECGASMMLNDANYNDVEPAWCAICGAKMGGERKDNER